MIAERDVDLKPDAPVNRLLVLRMTEGSVAAGGRGGGFGERRVVGALLFTSSGGAWSKAYEAPDEQAASEFEVPYYVSRIPMTLSDGTESMGYGVVEPELVRQMIQKAGI